MMGPTGIGVLWGRQERLAALAPFQYGGDMIKDVSFDTTTFNDAPWKFEAGTPNISGAIGLGAAADYVHALGPARMAAEETRLANLAIERIMTIPGARIIGPGASAHRTGVVSFAVEGIHPHDMATILDAEGVAVRGGHHCAMPLLKSLGLMMGTTRASFAAYNTEADVDALIRGIEKARTVLRVGA
jgi:cysteine desulfurase/selenocysteine lyase